MTWIWLTEIEKEIANVWGKEFLKDKGYADVDEMSPEDVVVEMIKINGVGKKALDTCA